MARQPGRMGKLGDETYKKTNIELADQELQVLLQSSSRWEELRPQIHDQETYDRLISAVQQATANNENLAQLRARIETLGKEGWAVAGKVIELIS